jgi:AraC-like DNA-binding protein
MKTYPDPQKTLADVPANVIRSVVHLLISRGHEPQRVCAGMGFSVDDLKSTDVRVSYRQTSSIIRRAMRLLDDPAMGLACGARQTFVSFGLPGLGMLTCKTLGDALTYLTLHQRDAGSLVINLQSHEKGLLMHELRPRFFDPELEPFLTEEILASGVSLVRNLIGVGYKPVRIELAYESPAYAREYRAFFGCPVVFGKSVSRIFSNPDWFDKVLPSYDPLMSEQLQRQFESLMIPGQERFDLEETISAYVRTRLDAVPDFSEMATTFNVSARTLRRRLANLNLTYQGIVDRLRYEASLDLLQRAGRSISDVAGAVGFSDERNFRRAFKRWSGVLPTDVRRE